MASPDYTSILAKLNGSEGTSPSQGVTPIEQSTMGASDLNQALINKDNQVNMITDQLRSQAATFNGQMILQQMIGDQTQAPENRAAAAQALNPGLKAQVTPSGTLAFSAAPGADLGFNYPNASKQTTVANNAGAYKKQSNAAQDFDKTYQGILAMDDPNQIANAYASLQGSVATFAGQKRKALEAQVGQQMGLTQLEQQMQADKVKDKAFYNQYYNGQDLGPTDESLETIRLYNQKKSQVDEEVSKRFSEDADVAAMSSRMQSLQVLVNAKNKDILSTKEVKDASKASLVPEESVRAAALALGQDYDKLDDKQRSTLALQIPTSPYYNAASKVGSLPPAQLALTAITDGGDTGIMANRVLKSQLSDSPQYIDDIKKAFIDFDKKGGLGDQLKKQDANNYKASYEIPVTVTGAKDRAFAQQQINANKMSAIMQNFSQQRDAQFANSVDKWDLPQDPALAPVKDIIADLKAKKQPVSIDSIISGLDLTNGADKAATTTALSNWINSQAAQLPGVKFFGPSAQFQNPQITKSWVQAAIVSTAARNNVSAFRIDPYSMVSPTDAFITPDFLQGN